MKDKHQINKLFIFIATTSLLLGCSHNPPAPVLDLSTSSPKVQINLNNKLDAASKEYIVMPGDTLFSIAWYHSVDYHELAQINKLKNNLIYPGQKLSLYKEKTQEFFDAKSLLAAINQEILGASKKQAGSSKKQPGSSKVVHRAQKIPKSQKSAKASSG